MSSSPLVVCIGASAGGVTALQRLLLTFTTPPPFPIAVVQHMPESSDVDVSLIYKLAGRPAHEAIDKMPLENGEVYFAPGGYHMSIEADRTLSLSQEEPFNFSRPSIDIFFESAARSLGAAACGVLLTGANADGSSGLKAIQMAGGKSVVQNPESAEVRYMPQAALDKMDPDFVLDLEDIPRKLMELSGGLYK